MSPLEARGLLQLARFADEAEIETSYNERLAELGRRARDRDRQRLAEARDVCLRELGDLRVAEDERLTQLLQQHASLLDLEEPEVPDCTLLGGSGYPLRRGLSYKLLFGRQDMRFRTATEPDFVLPHAALTALDVAGPGKVQSGGGFFGGGEGLEGFLQGAAVAAVLNAATTRTSMQTFLRLELQGGELFFLVATAEPRELRILLSPVVTRIRLGRAAAR